MTEPDPVFRPPPERIQQIHRHVELIKRLSDRVVSIGPFGLGLDGVLAWIPGAGLIYGIGAGGLLLVHAVRAEAAPATLARMIVYLVIDNVTDTVPVVGWAIDTLFPGHLMAANALQKDMIARHGPLEPPDLKRVGKGSVARSPARKLGWTVFAVCLVLVFICLLILTGVLVVQSGQAIWKDLSHRP